MGLDVMYLGDGQHYDWDTDRMYLGYTLACQGYVSQLQTVNEYDGYWEWSDGIPDTMFCRPIVCLKKTNFTCTFEN